MRPDRIARRWSIMALMLMGWIPLVFLISVSFQTFHGATLKVYMLTSWHPTFANYRALLTGLPVVRWLFNTFAVSTICGLGAMTIALVGGFALATMRVSWLRMAVIGLLIFASAVPVVAVVVPAYVLTHYTGLSGIPAVLLRGMATPEAMLIADRYIRGLPRDLLDAARIDGVSELGVMFRVAAPLSTSLMAYTVVGAAAGNCVDVYWPALQLRARNTLTLAVGLTNLVRGYVGSLGNESFLGTGMAAGVIMFLPAVVIFIIGARYFIDGFEGGLKG